MQYLHKLYIIVYYNLYLLYTAKIIQSMRSSYTDFQFTHHSDIIQARWQGVLICGYLYKCTLQKLKSCDLLWSRVMSPAVFSSLTLIDDRS